MDSAFEMIPEADEVHSNIDTAVNAWVVLVPFLLFFPIAAVISKKAAAVEGIGGKLESKWADG